jgi:hypothetical protein
MDTSTTNRKNIACMEGQEITQEYERRVRNGNKEWGMKATGMIRAMDTTRGRPVEVGLWSVVEVRAVMFISDVKIRQARSSVTGWAGSQGEERGLVKCE